MQNKQEQDQEPKQVDVGNLPLMKDLSEHYKGEIPGDVLGFRLNHAAPELAYLWHKMKAEGKTAADYYKDEFVADMYLADLTKYQLTLEINGLIEKMLDQMEERILENEKQGMKTLVCEYGGGLANFSVRCKQRFGDKVEVCYYDLDGPIKEYAKWRIEKHGVDVAVLNEDDDPIDPECLSTPEEFQQWDFLNCMDVLEHIPNTDVTQIVEKIGLVSDYIFINPAEIPYNAFFPQHISRYDVSPFFKKQEGYLWKNRISPQEREKRLQEQQSKE